MKTIYTLGPPRPLTLLRETLNSVDLWIHVKLLVCHAATITYRTVVAESDLFVPLSF